MWFTHLLVPQAVGIRLKSREFKGAVSELIAAVKTTGRIVDDALAREDVFAREEQGSTWIGEGVAVPHAATQAVNQPLIAHGHSVHGVRFGAEERRDARHVFLVLGTPASGPLHLRILARLAKRLDSPDFRQQLDQCTAPREVMAVFQAHAESREETIVLEEMPRVAAYVSGPDGVGLAAHTAVLGCRVRVLGKTSGDVEVLGSMRGVNVDGEVKGFARFEWVGSDPKVGLEGADLILVAAPVHRYPAAARFFAPHLHDGQAVVLIPGRLGGALSFFQALRREGCQQQVYVCESQTSLYQTEMESPAQVTIGRIENDVPLSALPAFALPEVLSVLNSALPYFVTGHDVLRTGLNNPWTFLFPGLAVLNAAAIEERGGSFQLFREGITPATGAVLEAIDRERVAVAESLAIKVVAAYDWLRRIHGATGSNLFQALRSSGARFSMDEPRSFGDPVVLDCLAFGLVPLVAFAEKMGVPTPKVRALIEIASALLDRDLMKEGCNASAMGLEDVAPGGIRHFIETGRSIR